VLELFGVDRLKCPKSLEKVRQWALQHADSQLSKNSINDDSMKKDNMRARDAADDKVDEDNPR